VYKKDYQGNHNSNTAADAGNNNNLKSDESVSDRYRKGDQKRNG
jgi:hypothetical protein